MDYYQEITLIPDAEMSPYFIWAKLYQQLHIALADIKNQHGIESIGVSFPSYKYEEKNDKEWSTLGNKLRLFAPSEEALNTLNMVKWLERLTDYVHVKSPQSVPNKVTAHLVVSRYRHTSLAKQVKNYIAHAQQKHGAVVTEAEAIAHCKQYKTGSRKNYPFISLTSLDTGQSFKFFIQQKITTEVVSGSFNTYGVNNATNHVTVPHW